MLRWRAATTLGRLVYADLLAGMYAVEELVDVIEARGDKVEIHEVSRADIEEAAHRTSFVRDLRSLPETTDDTPAEMSQAMRTPAPAAKPEPVPMRSTASRMRERAKRRDPEPSIDSLFPSQVPEDADTDAGGELAVCGRCSVPVAQGVKLCAACQADG
jgi:hypothetical protein